jgi:hypothetical protein
MEETRCNNEILIIQFNLLKMNEIKFYVKNCMKNKRIKIEGSVQK